MLIGPGMAPPASAAITAPRHVFSFTDPSGTDWTVPEGVSEVIVHVSGGDASGTGLSVGGHGKRWLLSVPVSAGDVLTVYPGKAPKYPNHRQGGEGFIKGGDGGTASLNATDGYGGGGAGALELNGELLAVAGGGGGGAGSSGYTPTPNPVKGMKWGGNGGDAGTGAAPTWGEGKHSSRPGENGKDDAKFAGYHKPGGNGGSAATGTWGGGGGGGGGGWPASGTGGGSGKKFLGKSAGSGGGAGSSWLNPDVPGLEAIEGMDRWQELWNGSYSNTAKIVIPLTSRTVLTGPESVPAGEDFALQLQTEDPVYPGTPLRGEFELFRDGELISAGTTDGNTALPVAGLEEGTHTYRVDFAPPNPLTDWWGVDFGPSNPLGDWRDEETRSSATLTVNVEEPEEARAAATEEGGEGPAGPTGTADDADAGESESSGVTGGTLIVVDGECGHDQGWYVDCIENSAQNDVSHLAPPEESSTASPDGPPAGSGAAPGSSPRPSSLPSSTPSGGGDPGSRNTGGTESPRD